MREKLVDGFCVQKWIVTICNKCVNERWSRGMLHVVDETLFLMNAKYVRNMAKIPLSSELIKLNANISKEKI